MGFNFRKSFKLCKGVKFTVSKSGVSTRIGGKGFSVSSGKRGTRMNVGIPGTGLSYSTKLTGGSKKRKSSARSSYAQQTSANKLVTFLLCLFLGFFGAHKFYLGRKGMGVLYFFTLGLFGAGWIIDTIRLYIGLFFYKNLANIHLFIPSISSHYTSYLFSTTLIIPIDFYSSLH